MRNRFLTLLIPFFLFALMAGSPAFTATGDVDGDSSIDGYDAVMILRHDVGLAALEGDPLLAADTDGSGEVDGYDAVLILRCDVGLTACDFGPEQVCGNGKTEAGETCDDGNTVAETCTYGQTSCTVCNASCQSAAGVSSYCGDGAVDAGDGETCDDGNTTGGDGCSASCGFETLDVTLAEWNGQTQDNPGQNASDTSYITIDSVNFTPPATGAPCAVSAVLSTTGGAGIHLVRLVYSVNGGAKAAVPMANTQGGAWTASIPAQAAGAQVRFFIWAVDDKDNVTTGAISSATDLVPAIPSPDDPKETVPDDMDILGVWANYDETHLYVSYRVQGNVSQGKLAFTLFPAYVNGYGIKILNPDTDGGPDLLDGGKVWFNVPMATNPIVHAYYDSQIATNQEYQPYIEQVGQDNVDHLKETGMVVIDVDRAKTATENDVSGVVAGAAEPEGSASGGLFSGSVKIASLGANPSGHLRLIVITGSVVVKSANQSDISYDIDDFSNYLTLYTSSYGYTAQ